MFNLPTDTRDLHKRYQQQAVLIVDDILKTDFLTRVLDQLAPHDRPAPPGTARRCKPWTLRFNAGNRPFALNGPDLTWPVRDYRDVVRAYANDPAGDQGLYYWYESLEATDAPHLAAAGCTTKGNLGKSCHDAGIPAAHEFVDALHQPEFSSWLAQTIGNVLEQDPTIQATLTRYRSGAFISPHTDWHSSEHYKLTFVLFLNPDWHPDWGGRLCFKTRSGYIDAINPVAGRLVLFEPSPTSDHWVTPVARHALGARMALSGWFLKT